jgi:hypothetical protein
MSLTTTTLASALLTTDTSIVVTSATGFAAGSYVLVDQELMKVVNSYVSGVTIPVLRGLDGSVVQAHPSGANATVGLGSDFANPGPQAITTYQIAGKTRTVTSYSASGAITMPTPGTDAVAIINGTSTLAMTLTVPTKDMDGCLLIIVANGKSASHVDVPTTGYGNAGSSYDVLTFQNAGQAGFILMACNGFWVIIGSAPITGTSTSVSIAIA